MVEDREDGFIEPPRRKQAKMQEDNRRLFTINDFMSPNPFETPKPTQSRKKQKGTMKNRKIDVPPEVEEAMPESRESKEDIMEELAEMMALVEDEEEEECDQVNAVEEPVKVDVTLDSGAVAPVLPQRSVPKGAQFTPNQTGKHFSGAGGSFIEKFGSATTVMKGNGMNGQVGCKWQVADVTRALQSVSTTTGPAEGPGTHDVLFNNRLGVVVPPGVVDKLLALMEKKGKKPIATYPRRGGLYTAEVELSGFSRQGPKA